MSLKSSQKKQKKLTKIIWYIVVSIGALIFLLPFFWMVSTSLKSEAAVLQFPPKWIPDPIKWSNYIEALTVEPFGLFLKNTVFITVVAMFGEILTASLVAYGFARFDFKGRNILFLILLSTMMLPGQVTMIPVFIMFRNFGWINTFKPLTIPAYFGGGAFYIFLLRQFFMTIPRELDDAAKIDGCNAFQIYYKIILPLSKPALATIAIFSFQGHWNDFMGPLIYLNDKSKFTLALGLKMFQGMFKTQWNLLMAASVVVMLPVLILFFCFQRQFIEGITMTGMKG
ncbi:sugar ABC transporter ATP-binding protein [Anoxybacter fermentans]|uniref:Sugar ABC transporter ATP-binding protein n=1 Tax=Anoxybacter fermentans TaxID=1323375 RepID=A0A3S9SY79_9FIRM|nr:carbohydrate ABC transporter permease [Anoxybacter fermentans]AZR73251.1 sugar ABC transporter ATP-binding protein [Anoxybacter fermentans]